MGNVLDSVRYNPLGNYYRKDLADLRPDQVQALLRERREQSACNRHILGQVALRAKERGQKIELEIGENYAGFRLPEAANGSRGVRGKVVGFSPAARVRLDKYLASLQAYPRIWQDFTFADDVMAGKSITERAEFSYVVMHNWQKWVKRHLQGIWGIWKREWQTRKSGALVGEWCPHFHVLLDWQDLTPENMQEGCLLMAGKWVSLTGSGDSRAFQVATNGESYRWLIDTHMAQVYVSKYVAKVQMIETDGSLGRFWGRIGNPPKGVMTRKALTLTETVWLRRMLPRLTRKPRFGKPLEAMKGNKRLEHRLGSAAGWLKVKRETISRLMAWIAEQPIIVREDTNRHTNITSGDTNSTTNSKAMAAS